MANPLPLSAITTAAQLGMRLGDLPETEIQSRWLKAFEGGSFALAGAAAADDCANAFRSTGNPELAQRWTEIAGKLRESAKPGWRAEP
jgi:hypothetical protein